MPIAEKYLERDFVVWDDAMTGRQVTDAAQGKTYIIVRLPGGQYAVIEPNDLRFKLKTWKVDNLALADISSNVLTAIFSPKIVATVQQASTDPSDKVRVENLKRDDILLVLSGDHVVGLLVGKQTLRKAGEPEAPGPWEEPAQSAARPGTLKKKAEEETSPEESQTERRYINAEIRDQDKDQPLKMGEVYELAFDVDIALRDTAVGGAELGLRYQDGEQLVELTVQLSSDDFEIHTEPQVLKVPRTGKSKGKARFDIEPKHEGEGIINAVFLKNGNFVQLLTLKLHTQTPGKLKVEEPMGRQIEAAFHLQPRDLNLTILETVGGFQVIMSGPVAATAKLPVTLLELNHMIDDTRKTLLELVNLEDNGTYFYQADIEIPPQVNKHALQKLANAGYDLYFKIFYGPAADAQANLLGDKLREFAKKDKLKIQIFSQRFMLPWGILYMGDDPDKPEPEMFLGMKHIIEHIPLQQTLQVTERAIDSKNGVNVSLNLNTDIDQDMGWPLIKEQVDYWQKIAKGGGVQLKVRETGDDVMKALGDDTTPDEILYFYCHAVSKSLEEDGGPDASMLVLTGHQRLTLEKLRRNQRLPLPGAPLVFINACESAELSPLFYDGFVPYFMAKGARGVIGTECETPAMFAAEWAKRFFKHFLSGEKSLGEIVLDLRREFYNKHNNLMGLLYALYVDGDTQVVPGIAVG